MNENLPLISVIVPIYNVAPYLRKCLDSLNNQTMKQIEVIMIDDGSTDESGSIADEYVSDDWPVFRIIHMENKGLSAARNRGIDEARAEWIMFVDSDDWVEPGFCGIPLQTAEEYEADIVAFCFRSWKNGKEVQQLAWRKLKNIRKAIGKISLQRSTGIASTEDAIRFTDVVAWNKLYRRNLFDSIRYPEGRVYEDVATTHKLIYAAKRVVVIPDILYNHIHRKNSISHTEFETNKRDGFISAKERYDSLKEHGCPLELYQAEVWNYAMGYLIMTNNSDEVVKQAEAVLDSIPGMPKELPTKKRVMLLAWKIDKRFFHYICRLFGKKNRYEQRKWV